MFSLFNERSEGKADENEDKKITNGELIAYLKDSVSQRLLFKMATRPYACRRSDKVLMSY